MQSRRLLGYRSNHDEGITKYIDHDMIKQIKIMFLSFSPEDSVWGTSQTSSTRFVGTATKRLLCAAVGLSNQPSSRHFRNIDPMKPPDQRLEQSRMIATSCTHEGS